MKYLRHKEKGILTPFNESIASDEWEVYEEADPAPPADPPKRGRKKSAEDAESAPEGEDAPAE